MSRSPPITASATKGSPTFCPTRQDRYEDAVAILTAHPGIDHRRIVDLASLVFDARGVTKPLQRPNLVRL